MKPCLLLLSLVPIFAQAPVHVDYTCTQEDFDSFGLTCSEPQPCAVFFEISAVDAFGSRIVVAGDIHTATTTFYGVLLTTEDGGDSWYEPSRACVPPRSNSFNHRRTRLAQRTTPGTAAEGSILPDHDPKAEKTGAQRPLFGETRFGAIAHFRFESALTRRLIFDDSVGKATHQELYATMNGGENLEMRQNEHPGPI